MKDFCQFLLKAGVKIDSSINLKDVKILKQNVKLWRKKYSKNAKKEKIATRAKDYKLLITPEQVEMYFNSDVAKSALAVLEKLEAETYVISRTEYCSLKDHIHVIILFGNACRSGVPAGLLMSQYLEAVTDSDGNVKMSVADHKTDYIFGDAPIVLRKDHFDILTAFANKAIPQNTPKEPYVFLSHAGKKMTGGDVSKRLHLSWSRSKIWNEKTLPKSLTVNIVRKSISTGIRETNADAIQSVCDTMCHSQKTSAEHYWMRQRESNIQKGTNAIRNYFFGESSTQVSKIFVFYLI